MTDAGRNSYLKRTYGITLDEFNQLLAAQDGKCCICGRSLYKCRIEVDHDHKLEKLRGKRASVRGLLCGGRYQGCNRRLGRIDNAEWLASASRYVANPPAQQVLAQLLLDT